MLIFDLFDLLSLLFILIIRVCEILVFSIPKDKKDEEKKKEKEKKLLREQERERENVFVCVCVRAMDSDSEIEDKYNYVKMGEEEDDDSEYDPALINDYEDEENDGSIMKPGANIGRKNVGEDSESSAAALVNASAGSRVSTTFGDAESGQVAANDASSEMDVELSPEGKQAQETVRNIDKYDVSAWGRLLREARRIKNVELCRDVFRECLDVFPSSPKVWRDLIEFEAQQPDGAEKIADIGKNTLPTLPRSKTWLMYLHYLCTSTIGCLPGTDFNPTATDISVGSDMTKLDAVVDAYKQATNYLKYDMQAGPLWGEYIWLVKRRYMNTPHVEHIRNAYHAALSAPGTRQLHERYAEWERSVSKSSAEELMAPVKAEYKRVERIEKELRKCTSGIYWDLYATPPGRSEGDLHQARLWKRYAERVAADDVETNIENRIARVKFVHNQSLLCLYRCPDAWLHAAKSMEQLGSMDDAVMFYERGERAVPECLSLFFAHAELLESENKTKEAGQIYAALAKDTGHPLAYIQFMYFAFRKYNKTQFLRVFRKATELPTCTYHVYLAAAQICEFRLFGPEFVREAEGIYAEAARRFPGVPGFLLEHARFFIRRKSTAEIRSFFTTALDEVPPESAKDLWELYLDYEKSIGDLASYSAAFEKYLAASPKHSGSSSSSSSATSEYNSLVDKYRFLDLLPCTPAQAAALRLDQGPKDDLTILDGSRPTCEPSLDMWCSMELPEQRSSLKSCYEKDVPPSVIELLEKLPPSYSLAVPTVDVDKLISFLMK